MPRRQPTSQRWLRWSASEASKRNADAARRRTQFPLARTKLAATPSRRIWRQILQVAVDLQLARPHAPHLRRQGRVTVDSGRQQCRVALTRCAAPIVRWGDLQFGGPARRPSSHSAWRTQRRSVSGLQPIEIDSMAGANSSHSSAAGAPTRPPTEQTMLSAETNHCQRLQACLTAWTLGLRAAPAP